MTVKIYTALGQEVIQLVDGVQTAGFKSVEWNSANSSGNPLASGVYYYLIRVASMADPTRAFTQTNKMVLMR